MLMPASSRARCWFCLRPAKRRQRSFECLPIIEIKETKRYLSGRHAKRIGASIEKFILAMVLTAAQVLGSSSVEPERAEIRQAHQWSIEHLGSNCQELPFSFVFGGRPASEHLSGWKRTIHHEKLALQRVQHRLTYADTQTGLQVDCVGVEYADFPVVEWTVYYKNNGSSPTPVLENINALDLTVPMLPAERADLRSWRGDSNTPDSYQPGEQVLSPGHIQRFAPNGGRPSNGAFPYFNLQFQDRGLILAIGWPGQWAASFARDHAGALRVVAHQELTHLVLHPGEQVRSPLIACLFWQGTDIVRAQNLWRRWMLAHNMPRPDGKSVAPIFAFCSGGFFEGLKVSENSEKQFIEAFDQQDVKFNYWWMDAGWYPCAGWPQVGTWEPDLQRFPHGLKAISDYVHARHMKLIVWFEPERVEGGTWLATNHPDWLLGHKLLNLGNPAAHQWLTEHVDRLIREQGIDLYRQDFNMDPLEYWRKNDAPDRQGITENLHVQGYLSFWDELRRRHPGLLIDSCASGGRRNDLETLRRAVPLLRSDYQSFQGDPSFALGNQGHTYGLSSWFPYYGQGVYYSTNQYVYSVRSHFSPAFGMAVDARQDRLDWPVYRRLADEWRQVAGLMLGDYYPLTPYSLDETRWIAWQFHAPDQHAGFIQAFRRSQNVEPTATLRPRGLRPKAHYLLTDFDSGISRSMSGMELLQQGLPVEIRAKPGSTVIRYTETR
jgi:alpha-galactosidase